MQGWNYRALSSGRGEEMGEMGKIGGMGGKEKDKDKEERERGTRTGVI
jgi:hypothetical protein